MCVAKGTESYFAPEVARIHQKKVNPYGTTALPTYNTEKADVFSLGILLFTMYFGQPPFKHKIIEVSPLLACLGSYNLQTAEIFFELNNHTSQLNLEGKVPKALKLLLVKMLALDPN